MSNYMKCDTVHIGIYVPAYLRTRLMSQKTNFHGHSLRIFHSLHFYSNLFSFIKRTKCTHARTHTYTHIYTHTHIYRVSQEECARLREGVPYVKVYRYNPKHLCPKLNGYGDNGQRKVWFSGGSTHCTCQLTALSMSVL